MKFCKQASASQRWTELDVDCTRANFCQLVSRFVRAWWRREGVVRMRLYHEGGVTFFEHGRRVYQSPRDAQTVTPERT
jgi:hypothetical protein